MLKLMVTVVSALVSKTTAVHPTRVLDMEAIRVQVLATATEGKQDSDTSLLVS